MSGPRGCAVTVCSLASEVMLHTVQWHKRDIPDKAFCDKMSIFRLQLRGSRLARASWNRLACSLFRLRSTEVTDPRPLHWHDSVTLQCHAGNTRMGYNSRI